MALLQVKSMCGTDIPVVWIKLLVQNSDLVWHGGGDGWPNQPLGKWL